MISIESFCLALVNNAEKYSILTPPHFTPSLFRPQTEQAVCIEHVSSQLYLHCNYSKCHVWTCAKWIFAYMRPKLSDILLNTQLTLSDGWKLSECMTKTDYIVLYGNVHLFPYSDWCESEVEALCVHCQRSFPTGRHTASQEFNLKHEIAISNMKPKVE